MGFALVLIVGYRAPWSSELGLAGTAAELAGGLRLARSQAIADDRPVAFALIWRAIVTKSVTRRREACLLRSRSGC